ncbi:GTP-binding protein [Methylovulum psychrotolerans]|uniref:non-specific serine/threonine protein kinase n=2 Tax=Methylovulum psychrotolerans TaxID=1704499 RepID=A0A2S5CL63_9GAMM|nr:GTP-binding protein [Methylovulum psychrotolerans]
MDRDKFRKEVEAGLEGKSRAQLVAFAVRSAMRVLPLLAVQTGANSSFRGRREAFGFWQREDKNAYLLSLLRVYSVSVWGVSVISFVGSSNVAAYAAARDAAYAAYAAARDAVDAVDAAYADADDAAYAAARAARAADAAARAADAAARAADAARAAARAAYAAAYAAADADAAAAAAHAIIAKEIKTDLDLIGQLTAMQFLQAPLWSSPPPEEWQRWLSDFKADALSLDVGFEVWLDWYEERLQGQPIDADLLEQWANIPEEVESQGVAAINAYLKNLVAKSATQPLNRVRAIFIGYGEAGKTSLIRALHNEPVLEGREEMTAGIDIRNWQIPDTEIKVHFWDFGGQVMAHATHQFFLRSSCLYVLVLNARSEINSTEQAEYWLQHVKSFGEKAPVMIVGNKVDQASVNLDMAYLQRKYPTIVGFYPLSCTQAQNGYKTKFASFKEDFCEQLRKVGTHQMLFTQEQFAVLQDLLPYQEASAFLNKQRFAGICQRHGIGEDGVQNREWLLDILDKLGMVIHFPQLACLDEYILNPRWLTHGVYTLMYHRKPRLTEKNVVDILRDKPIYDEQGNKLDYPGDKCRFIMDAMHEFKLAYPLSRDTLMIPELLPSDQPADIPFNVIGRLLFEFVFRGFLPRHVMPELIVRRHEEIVGNVVWQRGVLLKHKTYRAQALIQADYHERVLSVAVQGREAKEYLDLLHDEVVQILARLSGLDVEKRLELPASACLGQPPEPFIPEKVNYQQVLNHIRNGTYTFIGNNNTYNLHKVLGLVVPKAGLAGLAGVTSLYIGKFINGDHNGNNIRQELKNSTVYGSVIAAATVTDCLNTTLPDSKATEEHKQLFEALLTAIQTLNAQISPAEAVPLEKLANRAETLVKASQSIPPDTESFAFSLSGIKATAQTLGKPAEPVRKIADQLAAVLL